MLKVKAERHSLAKQLAEVTMKWGLEKEALTKGSRGRSNMSGEEAGALRLELARTQKELSVARVYLDKWQQRAKFAVAGSDPANPTCDSRTLRSLISKEVMSQLNSSALALAKAKARGDSLELQNQALVVSSGLAAATAVSAIPADKDTAMFSPGPRRQVSVNNMSMDETALDGSSVSDSSVGDYQREIEEYDRGVQGKSNVPSTSLAGKAPGGMTANAQEDLLKALFSTATEGQDVNREIIRRFEVLNEELQRVSGERQALEEELARCLLAEHEAKTLLMDVSSENDILKSRLRSLDGVASSGSILMTERSDAVTSDVSDNVKESVQKMEASKAEGMSASSLRIKEILNSTSTRPAKDPSKFLFPPTSFPQPSSSSSSSARVDSEDLLYSIRMEVTDALKTLQEGGAVPTVGLRSFPKLSDDEKEKEILYSMISMMWGMIIFCGIVTAISMTGA